MTINLTRVAILFTTLAAPTVLIVALLIATRSIRNPSRRPLQAILIPALTAVFIAYFFNHLPVVVEDFVNRGGTSFPEEHLRNTQKHLNRFDIADLHCDTLLWGSRDFLKTTRHPFFKDRAIGAVDLPRLFEGSVDLQVFAAVNSVPRNLNFYPNSRPSAITDLLTMKAILERWPVATWFSPKNRVVHQFRRLQDASRRSDGLLRIVRTANDLDDSDTLVTPIRAIMAVEGLSCLNNKLETIDEFFELGIRILGPTHFFDTEVGGSQAGLCNCGLTDFGRQAMRRIKSLGMIVDLSHASNSLMADILDIEPDQRPHLMISHTGVNSVCPSNRNVDDTIISRIATVGGLVGITLFREALCGDDLIKSFIESVKYVSTLLDGVDSIALGSDWDGAVFTAVSAADTHILTAGLLEIGNFSHGEVKRIMHDNAIAFFRRSLPQ